MAKLYLSNNKLLINSNGTLATSEDCCNKCPTWARAQMRVGNFGNLVEQVWLVASGQPPNAPYNAQQVPGTQRNANWLPDQIIDQNGFIIYPPTDSTQSFYIIYDPVARTIRYKLSNADLTSALVPPPTTLESILVVPNNKLTSLTENYPINIFVSAVGETPQTLTARIKIYDCSLAVTGEPAIQLPDTEISWQQGQPQQNFTRYLSGGKLGKGFTITGSATMSWSGVRPTDSRIQGWFAFVDGTRDYII